MTTITVGDYLLQRLREWGTEFVFGYAGDGINGILSAWQRAENRPTFIQARHEEMAAFEAVGYAKLSGRVGVCVATSGPGAIHLLNGLYDAKLDHVPVVAIVGQTARSAMGGAYQQEVDLHTLFKDVAGQFCEVVTVAEQLPNVLDRAIRIAASQRTVTAVIVPSDLQEEDYTPLITIAKYWREWDDPRLVVVVLQNNDLNQVTWELRALGGSPQFLPSQELPEVDYAGFARSQGLHGVAVDRPEQLGAACDEAVEANRPCVLSVRTDPAVPPIPPHATWDQLVSTASSVLHGDTDRLSMIVEGVKTKVQEVLPGRGERT